MLPLKPKITRVEKTVHQRLKELESKKAVNVGRLSKEEEIIQ